MYLPYLRFIPRKFIACNDTTFDIMYLAGWAPERWIHEKGIWRGQLAGAAGHNGPWRTIVLAAVGATATTTMHDGLCVNGYCCTPPPTLSSRRPAKNERAQASIVTAANELSPKRLIWKFYFVFFFFFPIRFQIDVWLRFWYIFFKRKFFW